MRVLGFGVQGSGFRVQGIGFNTQARDIGFACVRARACVRACKPWVEVEEFIKQGLRRRTNNLDTERLLIVFLQETMKGKCIDTMCKTWYNKSHGKASPRVSAGCDDSSNEHARIGNRCEKRGDVEAICRPVRG